MKGRSGELLALSVALMLVLSGCAQSTPLENVDSPSDSTARLTATSITTSTPTPKPRLTPTSSDTENTSTILTKQIGEFTVYNLTEEKAHSIESGMQGFFAKLPENESERSETTAQVAKTSCREGDYINDAVFEGTDKLNRQGYRVYHAALTFNDEFNSDIQPDRVKTVITTTGKVAKYTTVIGAYNEYYEASCAFDEEDPESVKHFYYASAALGFELLLIQNQVYYKSALVLTRKASHTRAFRLVQSLFGDDALRILMSETHWLLRNSLQGANQFVGDEAASMNISLSEDGLAEDAVRATLEDEYGFEFEAGQTLEDLLSRVDGRTIIECGKQVIDKNADTGIGGIVESVENSDYYVIFSDGRLTETEINRLPVEMQNDVKNCLASKT